jgi:signal transduction histidine kinase
MNQTGLLARVTWLAVLVAGASGASVAAFSLALSDRWLLRNQDAHLLDIAHSLAGEVPGGNVDAWLEEERSELKIAGIEVGFFDGRDHPTRLPSPTHTTGCSTQDGWRLCLISVRGGRLAVAKESSAFTTHRGPFVLAGLIAVALTMVAAAVAARRVASWAVRFDEEMAQARRFAHNAAHELRTPLATMRAELELLRESKSMTTTDAEAAERVLTTAARIERSLDRLLILSSEPTAAPSDAVSVTELAEAVLDRLTTEQRARITVSAADDLLTPGDAQLLEILAANAIDNALKFSTERIEWRIDEERDRVRMTFLDRGPGIAAADRERVFEAFYRAQHARANVAGQGIGLALIAHIARLHGGRARFLDVAAGAALEITLPKLRREV